MAGTEGNKKAPIVFTEEDDSLSTDWPLDGWCWLNPPFRNVGSWAEKCKEQSDKGVKIISIWPISGDLNSIVVWTNSRVNVIHGRIWPEVRACNLCEWGESGVTGLRWNKKELIKLWDNCNQLKGIENV